MEEITPKQRIVVLARLLELLEEATCCAVGAFPHDYGDDDSVFSGLCDDLLRVKTNLINRLAYGGLLIGCEYRDWCGDLIGIVNKISLDEWGGHESPLIHYDQGEVAVYGVGVIERVRTESPGECAGAENLWDIDEGYFCLPGSNAYGGSALAELVRSRVDQIAEVTA
jgi:hypothetical protein